MISCLIFASGRTREYYRSLATQRITAVVPATVDCSRHDPQFSAELDRDIVESLGDALVVGTVANINPYKGMDHLLGAIARIVRNVPDVKALVVGPVYDNQRPYFDGLQQRAVELGIADRIVWAGARKDVRPFLKRMDVFICSSVNESSPMAVWEAMAMSLPVVSTDVGDVSVHIDNSVNGYVVDVGDEAAMAARACDLLHDGHLRRTFGERARPTAREAFSPTVIARKTENVYHRVLRRDSVSI